MKKEDIKIYVILSLIFIIFGLGIITSVMLKGGLVYGSIIIGIGLSYLIIPFIIRMFTKEKKEVEK